MTSAPKCLNASANALDGVPAFHITVTRTPQGTFQATATGHPEVPAVEAGTEERATNAMAHRLEEFLTSGRLLGG